MEESGEVLWAGAVPCTDNAILIVVLVAEEGPYHAGESGEAVSHSAEGCRSGIRRQPYVL